MKSESLSENIIISFQSKCVSCPLYVLFKLKRYIFAFIHPLHILYTKCNMIGRVNHKIQQANFFGRLLPYWLSLSWKRNNLQLSVADQLWPNLCDKYVLLPHQKLLSLLSRKYCPLTLYYNIITFSSMKSQKNAEEEQELHFTKFGVRLFFFRKHLFLID